MKRIILDSSLIISTKFIDTFKVSYGFVDTSYYDDGNRWTWKYWEFDTLSNALCHITKLKTGEVPVYGRDGVVEFVDRPYSYELSLRHTQKVINYIDINKAVEHNKEKKQT